MGKDYSEGDYKKRYDEGYVRSYPSFRIFKEKWQEYENIRKKVDTRYSKKEKGKRAEQASYGASDIQPKTIDTLSPPPYQAEKIYSADYSYIERNSLRHPILYAGNGLYRNVYTEELINEAEARRILEYAGYSPKFPRLNLLIYIAMCVVSYFLRVVGPLLFVIYGSGMKMKNVITYQKTTSGYILEFQMPATDAQKEVFKKRGNIYVYTGLIIGVAQLIFLFKIFGSI